MPLVASAVLAYVAGSIAGLSGLLVGGTCAGIILGGAAWLRRSLPLAAAAVLAMAGLAMGRATERAAHACESALLAQERFSGEPTADVAPGAFAPVLLHGPGCRVVAYVSVVAGRAPLGAAVSLTGSPSRGDRGLVVTEAVVEVERLPSLLPRLRTRAGAAIDDAFAEDAPLARALLVADTRGLSPDIRDRYAAAGLIHMLSISGLHVGIIAGALSLLLRAARVPPPVALMGSAMFTAAYVAMIGAPAPALRAAAMLGAASASRALHRPTSPWACLAIGAALPLYDPATAADLGYQLSVVGMVGLAASASLDRRLLRPRLGHWPRAVAAALLTSTVATIVTMPLVALHFGRVSLVAPLSNLLAAPLMAVAQPALFLALLLAPYPPAARFVAGASHPALAAFDAVARAAAAAPGASIAVGFTTVSIVLLGVGCACFVAACVREDPWPPAIAALGCLALVVAMPAAALPMLSPGRMELHMLDVGQGDALALRTPRGRWIVFDAGRIWRRGDAGEQTVVPYLRARGGEVVAFVLSHPHADHAGGAASVIRALRPATYVDPGFVAGGDAYRESLRAAEEVGTTWWRVRPGDSLNVDGVVIRWLAPDSAWVAGLADANLASTVAVARYGAVRMLLTGDAEAEEEDWLLATRANALRADVLKVAHHGSNTSTTPAFLQAVRPRLALVSVGAGNGYRHPDRGVLADLAAARATVLRSDRHGTVVVSTDGVALSVHSAVLAWDLPPVSCDGPSGC